MSFWKRLRPDTFSIAQMKAVNPQLANALTPSTNLAPGVRENALVHLGCGNRILPGFVNVDFLPESKDVLDWDLLRPWPTSLDGIVRAFFSEDVVEHFFFDEQVYLLACMNLALRHEGVARVLMPNLEHVVSVGARVKAEGPNDYERSFGVSTSADVMNLLLRFGGHRWLHDPTSFAALAGRCGFSYTSTSCADSTLPELSGINLRSEKDSLSFAADLVRARPLRRTVVAAADVQGASSVEDLGGGASLHRTTSKKPCVTFRLPERVEVKDVVSVVVRGRNVSQLREHDLTKVRLGPDDPGTFLDASMSSSLHSSIWSYRHFEQKRSLPSFDSIRWVPSNKDDDYFTLGSIELFTLP